MIKKKKILKVESNLSKKLLGNVVVPSVIVDISIEENKKKLIELGFTSAFEVGETLLPSPKSTVTSFNANGKEVIREPRSKETRYSEFEWTREQWAGRNQTKTVTSFVIRPYERWYRDFIEPPSIEIAISKIEGDNIFITTPGVVWNKDNEDTLKHQINILLELFHVCMPLTEDLVPSVVPTKHLNWRILPPGERPWAEQKILLKPLFDLIKDKKVYPVIDSRLEDVNKLKPSFTAIGTHGFGGYVVFGFPEKDIYILESALYGNAIYVFDKEWKKLTQMSKAEVLKSNLQIERITHSGDRVNWVMKLKEILIEK